MKSVILTGITLLSLSITGWAQQREAYHELSHAIVAHHLGAIVNKIRLVSSGEIGGQTLMYDRNLSKRQQAMVSIAGYVGERVFLDIDRPEFSEIDFKEAERLYGGDLNDLVPEVEAILRRDSHQMLTLASELAATQSMTGQRFRQSLAAREPGSDHPATRAEGRYLGKVAGQNIHLGGKPPWAGDGWNQLYADWQDSFEGPLCFFSGLALGLWGVICIWLKSNNKLTRAHWLAYKVCFAIVLGWVAISTYVMYGIGPSN